MQTATLKHTTWRDYWSLTKPRVVMLMLLTAWVGMLLASPPAVFPFYAFVFGTLGIGLCASSAAVVNQLVEGHIDARMNRTQHRPVASGRVPPFYAMCFALLLGTLGLLILSLWVNPLTAWLTLGSSLGYAFFYTLFLKRATPQNIVIGGIYGAAPPLLGWTAVTGQISPESLLLVLIIFTWTPPHFWALAIYRHEDYARAQLPMLPVTHGIRFTKLCVLLYTILLIPTTILPYLIGMNGLCYLMIALGLGLQFLYFAVKLFFDKNPKFAMKTFGFSIIYLMALFVGMLLDHYLFFILDYFWKSS